MQMAARGITEAEVEYVLLHYPIRFPDRAGNPKYSAFVNGRVVRVVVVRASDPPIIKTVWVV